MTIEPRYRSLLKALVTAIVVCGGWQACLAQQQKAAIPVIEKFKEQSRGMGILQGQTNTIGKAQLHRNLLDAVERHQNDANKDLGEISLYLDDVNHVLEESQRNWTYQQQDVYRALMLKLETLKQAHEHHLRANRAKLAQLRTIHENLVEQVERRSRQQSLEDENVRQFDKYAERLEGILDLERQLNGYQGSLTSSYVSQIAKSRNGEGPLRETYVVSLAANINKNIYPGELNFSSQLQVNIDGGSFQEQVTNLFMSYDYDIAPPGKLGREVFGFVSRYSNSYLHVDQRYEGGIGYTFDFKSGRLRSGGVGNHRQISGLRDDLREDLSLDGRVQKCSDQLCQVYPDYANLSRLDSSVIDQFLQHTETTNRKKYRRSRFGFLVGGFVELEQIGVPDSVTLVRSQGDTTVAGSFGFAATQRTRIALRVNYKGYLADNISFSVKPWLIIPTPFFSDSHIEYVKSDGSVIRLADQRVKIEADLSADFGQASFSLGIVYNHDRAPNGRLIKLGSEEVLYTAPNSHFLTQARFTYRFE